tara:strand:- start:1862 stop:2053 length:192 start_codon:yes stop_codon:yes gene_type:complete
MTFGFKSKYGLTDIAVGETKSFPGVTAHERDRIKRSAHNYNVRIDMYFITRVKHGVLYVTRLN